MNLLNPLTHGRNRIKTHGEIALLGGETAKHLGNSFPSSAIHNFDTEFWARILADLFEQG